MDGHVFEIIDLTDNIKNFGKFATNLSNWIITDSEGIDQTYNYIVTSNGGTLEVTLKDITIKTGSTIEEYDANIHYKDEFQYNNSLYSEISEINIEYLPQFVNVGIFDNNIGFEIINHEGEKTTENYNIILILGTIEVTPKEVRISVSNATKIFDNTNTFMIDTNSITAIGIIEYNGIPEMKIGITVEFADIHIGENKQVTSFKVFRESGANAIGNYHYLLEETQITVDKLEVKITLTNSEANLVYNGKYQTYKKFIVESSTNNQIVNTFEYEFETSGIGKDAGFYINKIEEVLWVKNNDEIDITNDLLIVPGYEYGEVFQIISKTIHINVDDNEAKYDSYEHNNDLYSLEENSLYPGEYLEVLFEKYWSELGVYENIPTGIIVYDQEGNDITTNYNFIVDKGIFTIYKEVEVRFDSQEYTYNGEIQKVSKNNYYLIGLPEDYIVTMDALGSLKDVGSILITYDKSTLEIVDKYGNNVANLIRIIEIEKTYLTILKQDIVITSKDMTVISLDVVERHNQYVISLGRIIKNHEVTYILDIEHIGDDRYENKFYIVIKDEFGEIVTANYNIEYNYGIIILEQ